MKPDVKKQLDTIRDTIVETVPVDRIYLFGSHAYGQPKDDSDLDIYVVLKDDALIQGMDAVHKISLAIYGKKSLPTDVLAMKKSQFDYRLTAATLEREVANRGVLLYG